MSFHSQQQQLPNSSVHNTPHIGVGVIANSVDNTPSNGVKPGNQMRALLMVELGFYHYVIILQWKLHMVLQQQAMVMVVKVVVLYRLVVIIIQQKELHAVRVGEQATIHLTNVLGYQIQMIVPSLSGRHMCFFAIDDGKSLSK